MAIAPSIGATNSGGCEGADLHSLLGRCRRQERDAFAELFAHFRLRVARSAFLIMRREDFVDDVVQLVFIELFTAFPRYDLARPFLPWLYRIVYNVCMDYLKRNTRDHRFTVQLTAAFAEAVLRPDATPGPAELAERSELQRAISAALERLPVKQRSVIVLRYYDDLSEAEMAEVLQCRPGTIKSRLYYAHRALKEELLRAGAILPADHAIRQERPALSVAFPAGHGGD